MQNVPAMRADVAFEVEPMAHAALPPPPHSPHTSAGTSPSVLIGEHRGESKIRRIRVAAAPLHGSRQGSRLNAERGESVALRRDVLGVGRHTCIPDEHGATVAFDAPSPGS